MKKHRSNKMTLERIPPRKKVKYPKAPSYVEMGKTKPIKRGRNKKEPRPYRDVKVFMIKNNRAERREELRLHKPKESDKK